jgi:hypothetical protein
LQKDFRYHVWYFVAQAIRSFSDRESALDVEDVTRRPCVR